jgi:hypothetical protein
MPTWAAEIILTSLAPSPIDIVTLFPSLFRTMFTTSAFYLGDTRQANTLLHLLANSVNS